MPTHHIASWLIKHSDIPLTVLKPVASKIGISTNYLGAALFAGQIIYENQDAIVKYANTGGVAVGGFLHERAAERYGEDHALTQYLGENVAALNEAFEGTEEEARTFAEFYRQFRAVERDTPDVADKIAVPESAPDIDAPDVDIPIPESVLAAVPDRPSLSNSVSDPEEAVDIPVRESE